MIVLGKNGEPFATITRPFRSFKFPLEGEATIDYHGFHRGDNVAVTPISTCNGVVSVMLVHVHETEKGLVRDPKSPLVNGWVAGKPSEAIERVFGNGSEVAAASKELNAVLREERLRG